MLNNIKKEYQLLHNEKHTNGR